MRHLANIRHIFSTTSSKMLNSCEVDFWVSEDVVCVLFTDINDGMSVTNATEILATESLKMLKEVGVPVNKVRFFETYNGQDNVDEVEYTRTGDKMSSPRWKPCPDFWDIIKP